MYVKKENGLRVLYPDNPKNIIRSILTNNRFNYVFLSRDDSEQNYVEEEVIVDDGMTSALIILENLRNKKMNDLDTRYEMIKKKILNANTKEELISIDIF